MGWYNNCAEPEESLIRKCITGQSVGTRGKLQGGEAGKRLSDGLVLRDSGKVLWGQWG